MRRLREVVAHQAWAHRVAVRGRPVLAEQAGRRRLQPEQPVRAPPAAPEVRAVATGTGITRWSIPSRSTVTGCGGARPRRRPPRRRRPSGPAVGRPPGSGWNGDGVVAASGTRYGRVAAGERQVEDPARRTPGRRCGWTGRPGAGRPVVKTGLVSTKRSGVTSTTAAPASVGDPGGPDLPQRLGAGVRPGQPGGVGGEGQPGRVVVAGPVDLPDLAAGHVDDQHPAVVRWPRRAAHRPARRRAPAPGRAGRRRRRRTGPAAVRRGDLDRVVAVGVGHPGHRRHRRLAPRAAARAPAAAGRARRAGRRAPAPARPGWSASARCRAPRPRWPGRCGRRRCRRATRGPGPGAAAGRCAGRRA